MYTIFAKIADWLRQLARLKSEYDQMEPYYIHVGEASGCK